MILYDGGKMHDASNQAERCWGGEDECGRPATTPVGLCDRCWNRLRP